MADFDWEKYRENLREALLKMCGMPPLASGGPVTAPSSAPYPVYPAVPPLPAVTPPAAVTPPVAPAVPAEIRTTGMAGFSEKGVPQEWDMAVGEVYGYRWWKLPVPSGLAGFRGMSASYGAHYSGDMRGANNGVWKPGRNEAVCTTDDYRKSSVSVNFSFNSPDHLFSYMQHEPPEYRQSCGCGFWGYFDRELNPRPILGMVADIFPHNMGSSVYLPVFGAIKGSGRTIIGEKGFRTQYAEILGLCVPDCTKARLSWDIPEAPVRGDFYYSRTRYQNSTFYQAMTGPLGWYAWDTDGINHRADAKEASEDEVLRRVAAVETILGDQYPDVKIFSSQENLVKYFPPDPNYG